MPGINENLLETDYKSTLLLEIGCEELPSRLIKNALEQLQNNTEKILKDNHISFNKTSVFATPRRLVLLLEGVPEYQESGEEKVKGPPVEVAYDKNGTPTKAALGFATRNGLKPDDLLKEMIGEKEYLIAKKKTGGELVVGLLPSLLSSVMEGLRFPRSMYWKNKGARFARPVRWIICLLNDKIIPVTFAGLIGGRITRGHRFLSGKEVEVASVEDYFSVLESNYVMLDGNKRKELIRDKLIKEANRAEGKPLIDEGLLEEVASLVEYPEVIQGNFPREYLNLPKEVLITTMQVHQRFFPLVSGNDEELMPGFLGVSNNRPGGQTKKGYEKVLQARLSDARFFYEEDTSKPFDSFVTDLERVVYQETLGTLFDKTERITKITKALADLLKVEEDTHRRALRAAYLSKADLVTAMVYEFPELQGIMGREYALLSGEDDNTAMAVYEHYQPRFAGDKLPETPEGIIVSIADRLDTLCGCFTAGIQPTGSQDPYGLRRQAQGVVSILLDKELNISLPEIINITMELFAPEGEEAEDMIIQLRKFFVQRITHTLQEKGLAYDVIQATLGSESNFNELIELYKRTVILEDMRGSDTLNDVIAAYTRVNNLARRSSVDGNVNTELFNDKHENNLWQAFMEAEDKVNMAWDKKDHNMVLKVLASLRPSIDSFFDDVMVMVEDELVRDNRLKLLTRLKALYDVYADFSILV